MPQMKAILVPNRGKVKTKINKLIYHLNFALLFFPPL